MKINIKLKLKIWINKHDEQMYHTEFIRIVWRILNDSNEYYELRW